MGPLILREIRINELRLPQRHNLRAAGDDGNEGVQRALENLEAVAENIDAAEMNRNVEDVGAVQDIGRNENAAAADHRAVGMNHNVDVDAVEDIGRNEDAAAADHRAAEMNRNVEDIDAVEDIGRNENAAAADQRAAGAVENIEAAENIPGSDQTAHIYVYIII